MSPEIVDASITYIKRLVGSKHVCVTHQIDDISGKHYILVGHLHAPDLVIALYTISEVEVFIATRCLFIWIERSK